jgi:protein SCO1
MKGFLSRHPALSIAALLLLAVACGAALQSALRRPDAGPAAAGQPLLGGPFELLDRDGRPFTEKNLLGRPFALYFGYIRCPDVCPTTLMKLATWRRALGQEGEPLQIVFVSVDPEIDTPAAVGAYADLFRSSLIGLTGTADQIERITRAYRVVYAKVPQPSGGYNIDHSTYVYLADDSGRFSDVISPLDSDEEAKAKLRKLTVKQGP